jgi:hypothetical protein
MPRKKTTPAEEPPQTINFDAAKKAQVLAKNAVQLAEFAATANSPNFATTTRGLRAWHDVHGTSFRELTSNG